MSKISPFLRVVIGGILAMSAVSAFGSIASYNDYFVMCFFVCSLAVWLYACYSVEYISPAQRREEERRKRELEILEARQAVEAEEQRKKAEAEARQAEWNRLHGRMNFNVAGVMFKNSAGVKRQDVLREMLAADGDGEVYFEEYEYDGRPAVRVMFEGMDVGNVPASRVSEFFEIDDRVETISYSVRSFTPEDVDDEIDDDGRVIHANREKIYSCKISIVYSK